MAVVREFTLPDLGEGLTEAEIVRWLVAVGEVVAVDQPVVEVETAKAMVEVPCPYGGVVTARFGEEGTELPVGAPLLTVAVGAEIPRAEAVGAAGPGAAAGTSDATGAGEAAVGGDAGREGREGSGNVLVGYGTGAPAARRRRVRPKGGFARSSGAGEPPDGPARSAGAAPGSVSGAPGGGGQRPLGDASGVHAGVDEDMDAGAHTGVHAGGGEGAESPVAVISPLVRRIAREHGIDLRALRGSGPDGLVLRADVEEAARELATRVSATGTAAAFPATQAAQGEAAPYAPAGTTGPAQPASPAPAGAASRQAGVERVPLRGVRGAVAEKMARSRTEIPDASCWVDADATELLAARMAMNAGATGGPEGPKVSLLALLARICTAALARYPELNSTVDTEAREVVRLPDVHLGFAAQTERGLVVPVVRDAHARNAVELTREFARLTETAREGRLTPAELTGGTFTLNNYGVFGVDGSTPIINHPEAAMLGVGRIVPKPWVHQGELAVRQVVQLSLTFDHRVCDGGTAGGFLRFVADCVERPAVLLRTL
ncbi:dihydrolipoamide acetyltransferase family protein [Streptomyces pathocidini]|uniref:dihydrolipoamide acetyltransferase family protein n=1 Tax=Streptomyces pathocidini TaxID=1650571 RepID=UPI0033E10481